MRKRALTLNGRRMFQSGEVNALRAVGDSRLGALCYRLYDDASWRAKLELIPCRGDDFAIILFRFCRTLGHVFYLDAEVIALAVELCCSSAGFIDCHMNGAVRYVTHRVS